MQVTDSGTSDRQRAADLTMQTKLTASKETRWAGTGSVSHRKSKEFGHQVKQFVHPVYVEQGLGSSPPPPETPEALSLTA